MATKRFCDFCGDLIHGKYSLIGLSEEAFGHTAGPGMGECREGCPSCRTSFAEWAKSRSARSADPRPEAPR